MGQSVSSLIEPLQFDYYSTYYLTYSNARHFRTTVSQTDHQIKKVLIKGY